MVESLRRARLLTRGFLAAALAVSPTLSACENQPSSTILLDEREAELSDDAEVLEATTELGPPGSEVPVTASFVVGRDGCAAVDQLRVSRSGGPTSLTLVNARAEREDCQRSPDGNRGRPVLVRIDWHGWMGCRRVSASGDGFRLFPDGHIESFMLATQ
jgi:hypothetical protein